ncbi:C-type lectin mosGCTL-7-like [Saccoglossus kowalevskii]|uniref:Neurocan core protein-like n=1 Tax=Saccoglossus kowalevskii TaxID=10224 RepID=A0ABM0LVT4_SACKO|nr:PREDICTED: neurocan core protein-like [Saccoglossus kowalevskii]
MKLMITIVISMTMILSSSCELIPITFDEVCEEGMRYKFYPNSTLEWEQARDFCESEDGFLATVNYRGLHKRLRKYINANPGLGEPYGNGYWIGLSDRMIEDVFMWTDLTELTYHEGWSEERIGRKTVVQPNNNVKQNCNGQDCIQMWHNPAIDGKLTLWAFDDDTCDVNKGFICQYTSGCEGVTAAPL